MTSVVKSISFIYNLLPLRIHYDMSNHKLQKQYRYQYGYGNGVDLEQQHRAANSLGDYGELWVT